MLSRLLFHFTSKFSKSCNIMKNVKSVRFVKSVIIREYYSDKMRSINVANDCFSPFSLKHDKKRESYFNCYMRFVQQLATWKAGIS